MSTQGYLIIAVAVIAILVLTFVVSFVLYKKTPAPKDCDNLKVDDEHCASCPISNCENKQTNKEKEEN